MSVKTKLFAVGILEDNDALRSNIVHFLEAMPDYFVVFSEPGYSNIANKEIDCEPDFVLLDIHLQDGLGIDLIGDIVKRFPETSVIIMTGDQNEQHIMKAFESGAKGYLYKPFSMAETVATMQALLNNGSYMSPIAATKLIGLINKKEPTVSIKDRFGLTDREYEIVLLIKEGLAYQAIADKLFISYHTVNHHLKNVYVKMNVKSRSELIANYLTH
jgi:DNA-binding NarL/FixJ family response regulator